MRIAFEQLSAEYPVFTERYCSDQREDRQNLMMLSCAVWAAEAGHEVEVRWDPDTSTQCKGLHVVFLVLFSVAAYRLKHAIDLYRAREDCFIIVCGPHAVSFPNHCHRAGADAVIGRCNRELFSIILRDVEDHELRRSYSTSQPVSSFPHYRRFRELGFVPDQGFMNVLSSTGCPYTCAFCTDATTSYSSQEWRDVLCNIESSDEPLVIFNDPTFGIGQNGRQLLAGLSALERRFFVAFTTCAMLRDAESRRRLADASFVMLEVGIENINSPFSKNLAADFVSIFSDCEFLVLANYIFGYDPRDFSDATLAFLQDLVDRCPNVLPMIFCPFSLPEAPLHREKTEAGSIFDPSYLCIGNEILSIRLPEAGSPRLYYEMLNALNDRLYVNHASRLRTWINDHPRIDSPRKDVMLQMLGRQERIADRFIGWADLLVRTAPDHFEPFAQDVLGRAVPNFDRYALALD